MPWQKRYLTDERLKFVVRLLDGEKLDGEFMLADHRYCDPLTVNYSANR